MTMELSSDTIHAIEQAAAAGLLEHVQIVVHRGAGSYVCGDETGLIESLEGKRGVPRMKPPFPAVAGAWGMPTLLNNVETYSSVPAIIRGGGAAYAALQLAAMKRVLDKQEPDYKH